MKTLWQGLSPLIHLFYPNLCEACGDELLGNEELLCVACWQELPATHFHRQTGNPLEQKFWGRIKLEHASSMYYFNKDARIQHALHALKYRGVTALGHEMGRRFGRAIKDCDWVNEIDLLLPVPLSEKKRRQRGYNQSDYIAQGLSDVLQKPVDTRSFIRIRNTESQTHKTRVERLHNMESAFGVLNPRALQGRHIALVDDVMTTGATLESCALTLQRLAGVRISILTLAYAID